MDSTAGAGKDEQMQVGGDGPLIPTPVTLERALRH